MGTFIKHPVSRFSEKEFHQLDYQIMSLAFDLHNSMGNLWDENDYKEKLLNKCQESGLDTYSEVPIKITHKNFSKSYFIDLLINGAVYELKAVTSIASPHETQTLNYLFLTDTHHGKIINFRPDSLKWRFVSTSLSAAERKRYNLTATEWNPCKANSQLPDLVTELLNDWGAYLEIQLYKEAILFFMGLPPETHAYRFNPLTSDSALHITGLSRNKFTYMKHLQKYLNTSAFQQVDWINFDQNQIEIRTLGKKSFCH